jgi:hypothetical protein
LTFAIAFPIFIFMKGITRGFAKNERDEQKLRDLGITTIYRSDRGETLGKFRMRKGELLGVVNLRAFGSARKDMVAAVKQVHKWGAVIVSLDDLRSDRDGVAMLDAALVKFIPSAEHAKEMQRRSVLARTEGRMSMRDAQSIWRNPRLTTLEAIDLMRGWSERSAYAKLGARGVIVGRRSKPKD